MNADLEAYLRGPAPLADDNYTDLQRQALAEAIQLSAEVVEPLESRIESDYEVARNKARDQLESERGRIERYRNTRGKEIQDHYDDRVEEIRADYERKLSDIKVDIQHRRKKVNQTAVELEQKAEKEHQDQVLVAEFVAEGAVAKSTQRRQETESTVAGARHHLDSLEQQANQLVRLYRQHEIETMESKPSSAGGDYASQLALAEQHLATLKHLWAAQIFVGTRPALLAAGMVGVALVLVTLLYGLKVPGLPSAQIAYPIAAGAGLIAAGFAERTIWRKARSQVRQTWGAFQDAQAGARTALEKWYRSTLEEIDTELRRSVEKKEAELKRAGETFETTRANISRQRNTSLQEIEHRRIEAFEQIRRERDDALRQAQEQYEQERSALDQECRQRLAEIQQRYDRQMEECRTQYETSRQRLQKRWDEGLARIRALLDRASEFDRTFVADWEHLLGTPVASWNASGSAVRFGTLRLDLQSLADSVKARIRQAPDTAVPTTSPVAVPALLEFPRQCSILLQSEREGRQEAIETLRATMARLFTSLPPGRVRFTLFDPVGLGENFAGFMHAGDYLESLVGGRIWTEPAQIRQQLEDLTGHMENVIQKYLRNEFETIEQYNEQAGELAEPYRFLVIADFPVNFNEESARRLSSIVHSGPRCGVHTLIAYDARQELPGGIDLEDISAGSIHLVFDKGRFVWRDPVLKQFPLTPDRPPSESVLTNLMHAIGKAGASLARVEVPFQTIAPTDEQIWSLDSSRELSVPLGRTGATRLQRFRVGHGVAQHTLIAGKTGSGKSTLLHVMVTNLALWYAPDQVEMYLIDFKQGVEFKTYVTNRLPHARAVAIESDREFGLSILQRLDAEMAHRGSLFRDAGVQDIAAYRSATGKTMPRTVLIVDEFQVFFSEDDKLAQDAIVLLEQLVRQGRAFGIHVVLGSQTLGGAFGLARSTMGQMAVRIALQCSEVDSQLVLDDQNTAARLLSRPGEAIYNDAGGAVAGNSPFQVAWLPDSVRDSYLSRIARRGFEPREPMIVFEGNVPADIRENRRLAACAGATPLQADTPMPAPTIWLGSPVTIKEPTAVVLRRQSGGNILMVGQRDEVAMNLMTGACVCLASQLPRESLEFVILDGSAPDSAQAGAFARVTRVLPHPCRIVAWNDVPAVIAELSRKVNGRIEADRNNEATVVLLVYGLQRYRMLRRSEDAFGFSTGSEEAAPRPDVQFAGLLRDGPGVGLHVIAWADTLGTLERTFDRQTLREFDHRILFQMSAADSSTLIDSPAANQLGFHRALLYSEEQGGLEKFRPYGPLPDDWLADLAAKWARR
ncbi:MAG TPA: FtsK/SpoIIIE domain-containing protein [Sedimentisphaerales bacterium]|nr:FtsK/SpoIIIE domain-containing protein [Sedimentisphaerales bacterium]HRS13247.1 FtsK/SpoIIIE domain-containing protein [Sedimentisphaerales bacterium]HRV49865.1 FtsK/SpoIIIE domain-containing protein [Sedimentisphaerales bacterium]